MENACYNSETKKIYFSKCIYFFKYELWYNSIFRKCNFVPNSINNHKNEAMTNEKKNMIYK